mmetsp:Transcript_38532/g.120328  ORF Transcript_38532/g.120328 Transcript_38532/m.120328 type:complete len:227 (+) Transcript_38532:884-1564(+)
MDWTMQSSKWRSVVGKNTLVETMLPPPKAQARATVAPICNSWLTATVGQSARQVVSSVRATCSQTCCGQRTDRARSLASLARAPPPAVRSWPAAGASWRRASGSSISRGCRINCRPCANALCGSATAGSCGLAAKTEPEAARRTAASKLLQRLASRPPNSSRCQRDSSSSLTTEGMGKSTARRHCGGLFQVPAMAILRADSKVQTSMATSAGLLSAGNSTCKTSRK